MKTRRDGPGRPWLYIEDKLGKCSRLRRKLNKGKDPEQDGVTKLDLNNCGTSPFSEANFAYDLTFGEAAFK
jgi:hypothetical protein